MKRNDYKGGEKDTFWKMPQSALQLLELSGDSEDDLTYFKFDQIICQTNDAGHGGEAWYLDFCFQQSRVHIWTQIWSTFLWLRLFIQFDLHFFDLRLPQAGQKRYLRQFRRLPQVEKVPAQVGVLVDLRLEKKMENLFLPEFVRDPVAKGL